MVPDGASLSTSSYGPDGVAPLLVLSNVSVEVTNCPSWIGLLETFLVSTCSLGTFAW